MEASRKQLAVHSTLFLATFIWGTSFLFTKILLTHIPPLTIACIRFSLAFILFFIFIKLAKREKITSFAGDFLKLLLLGIFGVTLYYWGENTCLLTITTASAALILALVPGLTLVLSMIFLGEKATVAKTTGLIIAFAGAALVILNGTGISELFTKGIGYLYAFLAAFSFSVYNIIGKKVMIKRSSIQTTAFSFLFGVVLLIPFSFFEAKPDIQSYFTWPVVICVGYLTLFCSIGAYFLWNWGMKNIEAGKASVYMNVIPLVAALLGWIFLSEVMSLQIIIGGCLIIIGIILTNSQLKLRQRTAQITEECVVGINTLEKAE